ncbi:MAG: hemolysin family protein [Candidatus Eisenbacteria bacterium]
MLRYLIYILAIAVSVAGVAFFAGSEISFVSANRFRISGMAKRKVRGACTAKRLLDDPATLLSVTLVGTNIFVVLASSLATSILDNLLGGYAVLVSTVSVTAVILVFGEIVPKAVARTSPEAFLMRAAPGLGIAYYLLYPVARVTSVISALLATASLSVERKAPVTRDEIRALVKEVTQAGLGVTSYTYAHRVLDLSRVKVTGVMLPMDEVVCVNEGATVGEALATAEAGGHSRYPVYKRTSDNLVGILHIKDLLGVPGDSSITSFVRRGYFVPETRTVKEAIREMRDELRHLGIVTDEYGRPIGILTFEDLVEEIMGEIRDEYDQVNGSHAALGRVISGSTPVSLLREELEIGIPDGVYDTVAGFILDRTGSICKKGDMVEFEGFEFKVVEVKGRRIRSIRITKKEA